MQVTPSSATLDSAIANVTSATTTMVSMSSDAGRWLAPFKPQMDPDSGSPQRRCWPSKLRVLVTDVTLTCIGIILTQHYIVDGEAEIAFMNAWGKVYSGDEVAGEVEGESYCRERLLVQEDVGGEGLEALILGSPMTSTPNPPPFVAAIRR